jgi:hypothetical protein
MSLMPQRTDVTSIKVAMEGDGIRILCTHKIVMHTVKNSKGT